jgi:LacI family transcriptional regulator
MGFICTGPADKHSERFTAYRDSLKTHKLEWRSEWALGGFTSGRAGGREGFRRFRDGRELPTAVVCASDDIALGVLDAVREAGMACPGDISVTGFGNETIYGSGALTELTTVDHSREELADLVVDMIERQEARTEDWLPRMIRLPVRLVERASCAPPKTGRHR